MKIFLSIMILIAIAALTSIAHERDIYNSCVENGHSGRAMWTKHIKCSPIEKATEE